MDGKGAVVAYCRVSTLEQKHRQGLFVERFYKDEGESGVVEDRRALRQLLRACKRGGIRAVILPSLDRLSRDLRLAENLFYRFEQAGVRILIADMPTYDGKDRKDVLIRQIRGAIAEENRKDIIERLWKGRQERVRRGLPPGGNVAYGYRREDKRIVLDTLEAEMVRVIFELSDRGMPRTEIASTLNTRGRRRRNGHPWSHREVAAILGRRPLYAAGIVRYGEAEGRNSGLVLMGEERVA